MDQIKVSIITVSFNSKDTIIDTIESVLNQNYKNIEHIIVDGGSTDGTVDILQSYKSKISKYISEKDDGIYDAMNKGIRMALGDIIGILNSDDVFYSKEIVATIANEFTANNIDAVYGDVQFVDFEKNKVVRYYSSKNFKPKHFKHGRMPAHPSFYARRKLFEKYGIYKTDYKIAADFELLLRFMVVHNIKTRYLNIPMVSMQKGGVSNANILSNFLLNKEIMRACRENGIKTNYLRIYSKYFKKIFEFLGN